MTASHFNTMDSLREQPDLILVHWNVSVQNLVLPSSTYLTEGKVILVATPGEKRSEDKTFGEACTSLLSEFNMACYTLSYSHQCQLKKKNYGDVIELLRYWS